MNSCESWLWTYCKYCWFVQNSWKISKKKKSCLSLKATLEFFFLVSGDLILSLWRFQNCVDSKFFFFFGILGFRGIGNIFLGFCFWANRGLTEIHPSCVTDCFGHTVRSNSIEEFTVSWICWRLVVASIFRLEFQGKERKGVACSNIL